MKPNPRPRPDVDEDPLDWGEPKEGPPKPPVIPPPPEPAPPVFGEEDLGGMGGQ